MLFELLFQILFIAWWNSLLTIGMVGPHAEAASSIAMSEHWSALTLPVNVLFAGAMLISLHKLFAKTHLGGHDMP
ncbi:MAG: hypothetical protein HRT35_14475 [Algicola sp.]|nr:hypothetical protein [Algicola sp.]